MEEALIQEEIEKKEILKAYRKLLRATKKHEAKGDLRLIRKAFDVALDAHKDMRRKSGEPYIYHPLAVAQIVTTEIGLGAKSIACALIHDVVEDTDITLNDIRRMFGDKVATIVDGLTKISGVSDFNVSMQAENFRKMLLTLAADVRVILIKLADRLHNMRTLESMRRDKQLKIASETLFLYAPLAHRLGLYAIKSELEDLALKYTEPEVYEDIDNKLKETQRKRQRFVNKFTLPIMESLTEQGFQFDIKGRTKSVYSIHKKMKKQGIPFEEVYDLFAIRIIIDTPLEQEKADCWKVYSIVTDHYVPSPDRLRDWISTPRANGYESLHTTVMSGSGQWVEVQIRTRRMDDIAEKGLAAHWKYKEKSGGESNVDEWLGQIRELLENPDQSALDFIDDFTMNFFADEIFVFTPRGELRKLPANATALDFAFDIHSEVGAHCIGAKVNNKLVPLSHQLKSGDQVEVLTSSKQKPKEDWLNYVVTGRSKTKIKQSLKEERRKMADDGKEIFERKFKQLKLQPDEKTIVKLQKYYKVQSSQDLFYLVAQNKVDFKEIKNFLEESEKTSWYQYFKNRISSGKKKQDDKRTEIITNFKSSGKDELLIGDNMEKLDYTLAKCCNPIPGDDVFGFITINDGIKIHRVNCPNAIQLMSNYAYRVVKAKWTSQETISFLAGIKVTGIDDMGIVNNITKVISNELHVNMRSISFDSHDGIFDGTIMVYVHDTAHLTNLIKNLKKAKGVKTVERITTV